MSLTNGVYQPASISLHKYQPERAHSALVDGTWNLHVVKNPAVFVDVDTNLDLVEDIYLVDLACKKYIDWSWVRSLILLAASRFVLKWGEILNVCHLQ